MGLNIVPNASDTSSDDTTKSFCTWLRSSQLPEPVACYYKQITFVHDDSSVINKFEASLTDDTRVIIYDRHVFIVQDTGFLSLPMMGEQTRDLVGFLNLFFLSSPLSQNCSQFHKNGVIYTLIGTLT